MSNAATEIAAVLNQRVGVLVNDELKVELAAEVARLLGRAVELQTRDDWLCSLDQTRKAA